MRTEENVWAEHAPEPTGPQVAGADEAAVRPAAPATLQEGAPTIIHLAHYRARRQARQMGRQETPEAACRCQDGTLEPTGVVVCACRLAQRRASGAPRAAPPP